jgi:hypothetical protein
MKTTLAIVLAVAAALTQAAQSDLLPNKGANRWIYAAFDRFEKDGLIGPRWGIDGGWGRDHSVWEAAVSTWVVLMRIGEKASKLESQVASYVPPEYGVSPGANPEVQAVRGVLDAIPSLRQDLALLDKLAVRFAPQLVTLGPEAANTRKDIAALLLRFDGLEQQGRAALARATFLPDLPETHWLYEILKDWKNAGVEMDDYAMLHRSPSKAELGLYAIRGCKFLTDFAVQTEDRIAALNCKLDAGVNSEELGAVKDELKAITADVEYLDDWAGRVRDLRRMIDFFAFEIRLNGGDPDRLKRSLRVLE